jgi:hypothetical protein
MIMGIHSMSWGWMWAALDLSQCSHRGLSCMSDPGISFIFVNSSSLLSSQKTHSWPLQTRHLGRAYRKWNQH